MTLMAKKRPQQTEGEPRRPNRVGVSLHVYIDPALASALESYLASTEPEVSKTAAVESALREFLRGKEHWPVEK